MTRSPVLDAWQALRRDRRTTRLHRVVACAILRDGRVPRTDKQYKALAGTLRSTPAKVRAAVTDLRAWLVAA